MYAETSEPYDWFTRGWLRFHAWRGTRPFWAGLFTVAGGVPIAYFPYAHIHLGTLSMTIGTPTGASALIIGVLLFTLGLTMWFHQIVRVFAGVATILLALVSLPLCNIGGLVIGFLLALIGGCLSVSWAPGKPAEPVAEPDTTTRQSPGGPAAGDPFFPAPRDGAGEHATQKTTGQGNGGRHSAG